MQNITNDMELTILRQQHLEKFGIEKGFPIHILLLLNEEFQVKAFFNKTAMDKYIKRLDKDQRYIYKIAYVQDVNNVTYNI